MIQHVRVKEGKGEAEQEAKRKAKADAAADASEGGALSEASPQKDRCNQDHVWTLPNTSSVRVNAASSVSLPNSQKNSKIKRKDDDAASLA